MILILIDWALYLADNLSATDLAESARLCQVCQIFGRVCESFFWQTAKSAKNGRLCQVCRRLWQTLLKNKQSRALPQTQLSAAGSAADLAESLADNVCRRLCQIWPSLSATDLSAADLSAADLAESARIWQTLRQTNVCRRLCRRFCRRQTTATDKRLPQTMSAADSAANNVCRRQTSAADKRLTLTQNPSPNHNPKWGQIIITILPR